MASLTLTVQPKIKERKITVTFDADKFERLAASFGLFNSEFLQSIDRAEADYRAGRYRAVRSLKSVRA